MNGIKDLVENNNDQDHGPIIETFGCRDPTTTMGSRDGAFVYAKTRTMQKAATFQNDMEFTHSTDMNQVQKTYISFIKLGYLPMTKEDLQKTAGLYIDQDTLFDH